MISYIREYGITQDELETLEMKLSKTNYELLVLNEKEVRKVLELYNEMGYGNYLYNIFNTRIDLILIPFNVIKNIVDSVDPELLTLMIKNNLSDLMVLGV